MAAIAQGDIFVGWSTGSATFSTGGEYVSGETRVYLYQLTAAGSQKDFWLLNVDELQVMFGSCTDGQHYYGPLAVRQVHGGAFFDETTTVFKVHANGESVEYFPINTGGRAVGSSTPYGIFEPFGLITDGCGTFWALYQNPIPTSTYREYDSSFSFNGNTLTTPFTASVTAAQANAFVSREQSLLVKSLAGGTTNIHNAIYLKNVQDNSETLVYEDSPFADQRFIIGSDYSIPREEWLAGILVEGVGADPLNYIWELRQDGSARVVHSYPWANEGVTNEAGITISPDGSTWYFALIWNSSGAPLETEFRVYAVPVGSGAASLLWSSGLMTVGVDPDAPRSLMNTFNSICCIKPQFCVGAGGGRQRMYTTAVGIH